MQAIVIPTMNELIRISNLSHNCNPNNIIALIIPELSSELSCNRTPHCHRPEACQNDDEHEVVLVVLLHHSLLSHPGREEPGPNIAVIGGKTITSCVIVFVMWVRASSYVFEV